MELKVERSGYVADIDAQQVARVAFKLGAGRAKTDDAIDPSAGVLLAVTHGDRVEKGSPVAKLFAKERASLLDEAAADLAAAFSFSEAPPAERVLVLRQCARKGACQGC